MTDRVIYTLTGHTNPTDILTLADGQAVFAGLSGTVTAFNSRSGSVTLASSDVTTALGFTPLSTAVTAFNTRTGSVTLTSGDVTTALGFTPQVAGSYLTANQTITLSGDLSGSGSTAITATLATVNASPGTFGDAGHSLTAIVDGKGRVTSLTSQAIAIANTQVSGLGTASTAAASSFLQTTNNLSDVASASTSRTNLGVYSTAQVDAAIAASTGGGGSLPGTIADLAIWIETDNILASSGTPIFAVVNKTSWNNWPFGATANTGATVDAALLNSLPVLNFVATTDGRYNGVTGIGPKLAKSTVFVVFKPNSIGATQAFISGSTGALVFRIETTGALGLLKDNVANIGTSTTNAAAGTWYQANATYNSSTGAYAFRLAKTAVGSGTNVQAITAQTFSLGYDQQTANNDLNAKVAAIIVYSRVLSPTEIANVEGYITTKWGV